MIIRWRNPIWKFAPAVVAIGISYPAGAQINSQASAAAQDLREAPASASNSIDPTESAARLEALLSKLHNPSSLIRVQTIETIGASTTINEEAADNILRDALDDKDPRVAEAALQSLVRRGDEALSLVTETDLEKHPGETSELARARIAAMHQDTAALRELMSTGDAQAQKAAFEAMASIDTAAAVDALKAELLDLSSLHRLQTLELFVQSPFSSAPSTLIPILESLREDQDPLIRERAKQVLDQKTAESRQSSEPTADADPAPSVP